MRQAWHRARAAAGRFGVFALLAPLMLLSASGPAPVAAFPGAPDPIGENLLFVAVQDDAEVAIIDMDRLEVTRVVRLAELGFGSRSMPHDVAVSPDGTHWFVSLIGEHQVLQFDAEHRLVGSFEMDTPGMLGLDPAGAILLVSRSMTAVNPPTRIGLVRTADLQRNEVDVLLPRPHGIVVHGDGRYAYTASLGANQMASIDLESDRIELVDVEGPIHAFVQLAVSPDGSTLVGSGELSGELVVFDLVDPARPAPVASVEIGARAFDPRFHPDGETVWIPVKSTNEVIVVETAGWTVVARIQDPGLAQPHALRFSTDGTRAFVTNNGGADSHHASEAAEGTSASLVVIDTATHEVEKTIAIGRNLTGLGSRPGS